MVLLTTASFLTITGFGLWIFGYVFDRQEFGVIGAVFVFFPGVMILDTGIEHKTGEDVTTETIETTIAAPSVGDAVHLHTKDVSGEDGSPTGHEFNEVGDKLFVTGDQTDTVYEYDTASFDISLATLDRSLDVASEDTEPRGVDFSETGTTMFISGAENGAIFQYDLTEAYNLSTASYVKNYSVSSETGSPRAVVFDDAGDMMWVVGAGSATVYAYSLSTAYDVGTATLTDSFDVSSVESTPTGISFSEDGTRMLITGESSDTVYEYELSTAFDITTAEYAGENLDVSGQAGQPAAVSFEDGGRELVLTDYQGATLEEYRATATETTEVTNKTTQFSRAGLPRRGTIGSLLMLVGGLLAIYALEEQTPTL